MSTPLRAPAAEAPTRDGLWPMPPGPAHEETHLRRNGSGRDLVSATAEGLILSFAVAAGLAGAAAANPVILAAGLAVAAAGCVVAGLGRYLAARGKAELYAAERRREEEETIRDADRERWEVAAILHRYGVHGEALRMAVDSVCAERRRWVDFMMRFELDLKEPVLRDAAWAAAAAGGAHSVGGLVALSPYMLMPERGDALAVSSALTAAALAALGGLKARAAGLPALRGAARLPALGGLAALAAAVAARAAGG